METTAKPQDNKHRILQVAARLFAQHGYDGVSVREIAENAGVTKPVIYYYFKNKKDLHETLIQEAFAFTLNIHNKIYQSSEPVEEKLRSLMKSHFDYCKKNPDIVKILFDTIHDRISSGKNNNISIKPLNKPRMEKKGFRNISEFIRNGQVEEVFRKDVEPVKVDMLFLGAMNMYIMYQLHSDKDVISDKVANELVDIILYGIMHNPKNDDQGGDTKEVVAS